MTSGSGPPFAPASDPDMSVRLGALPQPGEAARQVAQVHGQLPGQREMAQSRVEAARGTVFDRPGEWKAAVGHPASLDREVDLVLGEPQKHAGVGSQVAEQIDLVVPLPLIAD